MVESGWFESKGQRIGFVNAYRQNDVIVAYFANEGRKRGVQYNDEKEQVEPDPFYSFEHIFIALFEDTSQLLIQNRYIYDYIDLGLPIMRNNLLHLLTDLFRRVGVYIVGDGIKIESAGMAYSQEELYSTFIGLSRVIELEITELNIDRIPSPEDPKYKLFNPKAELDPISWMAVAETLEAGLDHVTMETSDLEGKTLQAPIPKAFAAVGEIEKIRGYDQSRKIIYRQRREDEELEIELPADQKQISSVVDRILINLDSRGRVESWLERKRRREALQGGLLFSDDD